MDDQVIYLLDVGAKLYATHNYPPTPFELGAALGIRMIAGDEDSANAGPPAVITYNRRHISKKRWPLWHEIAHVVSAWFGIEQDLQDALGLERAGPRIEAIADLLAGLFAVPAPLVQEAIRRHKVSPEAISFVAKYGKVDEAVALRRVIHHDVTASRAGAIITGSHVMDLASQNYNLPLEKGFRIPEPHISLPNASLRQIRRGVVLAVWHD